MTAAEMIARARDYLREVAGSDGAASPFAWDDRPGTSGGWLALACNQVCEDTDCYNTSVRADLPAGRDRYCGPELYKIEYAGVTDGAGRVTPLGFATPEQMDRDCPRWRIKPEGGTPRVLVDQGLASLRLYPVPDLAFAGSQTVQVLPASGQVIPASGQVTPQGQSAPVTVPGVAGGLLLEGFGVPDPAWVAGTGECPLPRRAHWLVVFGAALLRAQSRPELYGPAIPILQARYSDALGRLSREVHRFTPATRFRDGGTQSAGYGYGDDAYAPAGGLW